MDERHAVAGVAALAHAGLGDATAVYLHPGRLGAHLALEEGLLHLWNQLGRPDHHAADGDELVDVCKAGRGQLVPAGRGPPQAGGQLGRVWLCCPAWENLTGGMEVLGWRGSQGDTTARARTSRWVPSALAWDVPPVTSVLPLNPLSLLTLAELGRPEAAWGRPDL